MISNNRGCASPGCASAASRYDKMAEVFGSHGEFVEKFQDMRPALERYSSAT